MCADLILLYLLFFSRLPFASVSLPVLLFYTRYLHPETGAAWPMYWEAATAEESAAEGRTCRTAAEQYEDSLEKEFGEDGLPLIMRWVSCTRRWCFVEELQLQVQVDVSMIHTGTFNYSYSTAVGSAVLSNAQGSQRLMGHHGKLQALQG